MIGITDGKNRLQIEMRVYIDDVWSYDSLAMSLRNHGIKPSRNGWYATKDINRVIKYALNWAYGSESSKTSLHRSVAIRFNGKEVI